MEPSRFRVWFKVHLASLASPDTIHTPMSLLKLSLLATAACPLLAMAQRNLKDIPDPSVDVEQQALKLAPGLQINLWASDPMITKPIQMAWDAKGRLWVAGSAIYPQVKPGSTANDKIFIVEDTDGDGKADKSTIFYDSLLIPTGVFPIIDATLPATAPGRYNAAYVANSTEVLLLRDTDGDGKADDKQIVMSGFGTEDTHHIIHSFKGGPDGFLYINQSVYIHTHMETPFGTRRMLGSGIWQYRPDSGQVEMFALGLVNPWGHEWDRWGQSFATDGAGGEGINYVWPGATFVCLPNQRPRILKGLNPGQPKDAGLAIVQSRSFPDEWQHSLITNDFRGHRVNRFVLQENGSGYSSKQVEDVVTTSHGAFRPVDVRMGPDGGMYLADWYNPIIQHGEVDFRDERRDHVHGRIWRITGKDRPLAKIPNYAAMNAAQLLPLLAEPEEQTRYWAKQELKVRPRAEAIAAITKAVQSNAEGEAATLERVELLNAAQTLGTAPELCAKIADQLLTNADGRARSVAVRYWRTLALAQVATAEALGKPVVADVTIMSVLRKAITDEHPRVRLEAINALRTVKTPKAVELAMTALQQTVDVNLDYALWLTAWELADVWLPALESGDITFNADAKELSFVLKAASHKPQAAGALVKLVRENKIPADKTSALLLFIAESGKAEDLSLLLEVAADTKRLPDNQRADLLNALALAAKSRNVKPTGELNRVEELFASNTPVLKESAVRVAGAWKLESARGALQTLASAPETTTPVRQAAMDGLSVMGGKDFLLNLAKTGASAEVKALAVANVVATAVPEAAAEAVKVLPALAETPALAASVIESFLKAPQGPAILAAALKGQSLPDPVAVVALQKAGASGADTKALQEALSVAGKLEPMVQVLTPEALSSLITAVKSTGSAARGENIYRRAAMQCAVCHAIGSAGGIIGPNLVSLGSSAPVDYIIESLLEPSKKIKEGYATTLVTLKTNELLTGFLASQDASGIVLRDATGNTTAITRDKIAKQESVPVSLMPPGLTATLRRDEFVDLVRFLSELGKDGDFKIKSENTIRRWRVLSDAKAIESSFKTDRWKVFAKPNPDLVWTPAYSTVGGILPADSITQLPNATERFSVVQCEIDVTIAGKVGLKLDNGTGVHVIVDGNEVPLSGNDAEMNLPIGKHIIILGWGSRRTSQSIMASLVEIQGSTARVQAVGGP